MTYGIANIAGVALGRPVTVVPGWAAWPKWAQTLYTFAVMHQVMNPGFASSVPYNVSQVDLDEGVRMVSNVVGIENAALKPGMRLEVVFESHDGTVSIPKFQPAQQAGA